MTTTWEADAKWAGLDGSLEIRDRCDPPVFEVKGRVLETNCGGFFSYCSDYDVPPERRGGLDCSSKGNHAENRVGENRDARRLFQQTRPQSQKRNFHLPHRTMTVPSGTELGSSE
ncbi:hypothetical protein EYF80_055184 [Liparis tanakae]|uniref:Uncharacterized protein n=1 Tax=Liparis tanakae TaxID=230148 RepID=A0A4Z2F0J2_9TELE|nr:hypothetical protein EYF80_055184 [Liparis tanakae]